MIVNMAKIQFKGRLNDQKIHRYRMPGDNCSVYGCGLSRRTKGFGIFQVPGKPTEKEKEKAKTSTEVSAKLAEKKRWRSEFLNAITKTRIVDAEFKAMIENDRVFACERHFLETDIVVHQGQKMTKRKLVNGTIPKYNMKGDKENDERIEAVQNSRPYRSTTQIEPTVRQVRIKVYLSPLFSRKLKRILSPRHSIVKVS